MKLEKLLQGIDYKLIHGSLDQDILTICNSSKDVKENSLFICIRGFKSDGHQYAIPAIEQGAGALIVDSKSEIMNDLGVALTDKKNIAVIEVEDCRKAMAIISDNYYDHPLSKLKSVAITGTKGKTTTSVMIRDILRQAGLKTGLIGTVVIDNCNEIIDAVHTTPESIDLHRYLAEMVENGADAVVLETSSQGFKLHRTYGMIFDVGIFTNIEPDHIGEFEHPNFRDYLNCKAEIFNQSKIALYNADDEMVSKVAHGDQLKSFGIVNGCNYHGIGIEMINESGQLGSMFDVRYHSISDNGDILTLREHYSLTLPGLFNVYNALAAISATKQLGIAYEDIKEALYNVQVKGRCECVPYSKDFVLMIDYAHNAMALESLLKTLRAYERGRLICLFGCGGNRARDRRFDMGRVSGKLSDLTIITSDNPRDEDPMAIINDIITGISETNGKYEVIADRREAIKWAIENAQKGDTIILAGKGHENYQEIKGKKYDMDERVIIEEIKQCLQK